MSLLENILLALILFFCLWHGLHAWLCFSCCGPWLLCPFRQKNVDYKQIIKVQAAYKMSSSHILHFHAPTIKPLSSPMQSWHFHKNKNSIFRLFSSTLQLGWLMQQFSFSRNSPENVQNWGKKVLITIFQRVPIAFCFVFCPTKSKIAKSQCQI